MSRLNDFYQQAHKDSVLKAELAELTQGDVAGVIGVAGNHGVSLAAADFAPASGALDDALEAAAGGSFFVQGPTKRDGRTAPKY
jgi:hypothetical protein